MATIGTAPILSHPSKCTAKTLKGKPCTRNVAEGTSFCKSHNNKTSVFEIVDEYTPEILRACFTAHIKYVQERIQIKNKTGLPIRLPNMPEDISENIVKFIVHNYVGDKTSKWTKGIQGKNTKISGDLISQTEGTQEVKCFTSDGPPSFGPKENWTIIYFLDAQQCLNDRFILWRVALSNTSKEWKGIKMNKNETHEDQSNQGRRPRIKWESLYPQIKDHCTKVFEGKFEDIFTPPITE
jgi:hypothetical protein